MKRTFFRKVLFAKFFVLHKMQEGQPQSYTSPAQRDTYIYVVLYTVQYVMVDECYNYFENLCVLLLARPNSISVFACMCACVCVGHTRYACVCECDEFSNALLLFCCSPFSIRFLVRFDVFLYDLFHVCACKCETFFMFTQFKDTKNLVMCFSTHMRDRASTVQQCTLIQISLGVFSCLLYKCLFCRPKNQMDVTRYARNIIRCQCNGGHRRWNIHTTQHRHRSQIENCLRRL